MSTTCCTQTKPNGAPCAARPLPGSDFCLFHDPAHAQTLAQSRSQGGAAPPPRLRSVAHTPEHLHPPHLLGRLLLDKKKKTAEAGVGGGAPPPSGLSFCKYKSNT